MSESRTHTTVNRKSRRQEYQKQWNEKSKRTADIVLSSLMLAAASPVMVLIALFIKIDSKGPVFYSQLRIGMNRRKSRRQYDPSVTLGSDSLTRNNRRMAYFGQPFRILKFRSMKTDAEVQGHQWCKEKDPRITKFGTLLRKSHLDELPQLFNILMGDMSLVGPRPERPEFMKELITTIPDYEKRLLVKPGLTGLAQIRHRSDLTIEDVKKKVKYDILYMKNSSLYSDIRIILGTVPLMFGAEVKQVKKFNKIIRKNLLKPLAKSLN